MTDEVKAEQIASVELPTLVPETLEMPADIAEEVVETAAAPLEVAKPAEKMSDDDIKAMAGGWKPKAEFIAAGGDPELWKPSKVFNRDGELYEKIQDLNKHVKSQKDQIQALVAQNDQIAKVSYQKALDDLKRQQRAAVEIGDVNTVEQTTEAITQLKAQAPAMPNNAAELPKPAADFLERNKEWFNEDSVENRAMKAYAIAKDDELKNRNPYAPMEERFVEVEKAVKSFYSNKFSNPAQDRAPTVAQSTNSTSKAGSSGTAIWNSLPDQHKKVFLAFREVNPKISLNEMVQKWKENGVL